MLAGRAGANRLPVAAAQEPADEARRADLAVINARDAGGGLSGVV